MGKKPEFDTLVDVIRQENGWLTFIMWWFSRLKFCISRLKMRRQKSAQIPFCGETRAFAMKLPFEEFNLICFLPGGSERLIFFEPTKAARLLKKL